MGAALLAGTFNHWGGTRRRSPGRASPLLGARSSFSSLPPSLPPLFPQVLGAQENATSLCHTLDCPRHYRHYHRVLQAEKEDPAAPPLPSLPSSLPPPLLITSDRDTVHKRSADDLLFPSKDEDEKGGERATKREEERRGCQRKLQPTEGGRGGGAETDKAAVKQRPADDPRPPAKDSNGFATFQDPSSWVALTLALLCVLGAAMASGE